jgi:hypothetical protein
VRRRQHDEMWSYRTDKTDKYSRIYELYRRAEEIDPEVFYNAEVERFQRGDSEWAIGCCPFHADTNPSFAMHMESGGFVCHATTCSVRGGDIVGFVSASYGLTRRGAVHWLEDHQWI